MTLDKKNLNTSKTTTPDRRTREKKDTSPTKVVIRRLPPSLTEEGFREQISPVPDHDYFHYVRQDKSLGQNAFARAYINFLRPEEIAIFCEKFDGYVFVDSKGNEFSAIVEYAPFQKVPKKKSKKPDSKKGTVEQDPDYQKFLESLSNPEPENVQTIDAYLEEIEAKEKEMKANHGVLKVTTPLLEFLKKRKEEKRAARQRAIEDRKKREVERRRLREEEKKKRREKEKQNEREKEKKKEDSAGTVKILKKESKEPEPSAKDKDSRGKTDGEKDRESERKDRDAERKSPMKERQKSARDREREKERERQRQRERERAARRREEREERDAKAHGGGNRSKQDTSSKGAEGGEDKPSSNKSKDYYSRDQERRDRNRDRGRGGGSGRDRDTRPYKQSGSHDYKDRPKSTHSDNASERSSQKGAAKDDGKSDTGERSSKEEQRSARDSERSEGGSGEGSKSRQRVRNKDRPERALYVPGARRGSDKKSGDSRSQQGQGDSKTQQGQAKGQEEGKKESGKSD